MYFLFICLSLFVLLFYFNIDSVNRDTGRIPLSHTHMTQHKQSVRDKEQVRKSQIVGDSLHSKYSFLALEINSLKKKIILSNLYLVDLITQTDQMSLPRHSKA